MTIRLGCIADDFTGATDLANNLVRAGMRVVQTIGVPERRRGAGRADVDAVVVALKSRTIAPGRRGGAVARGLPLAAGRRRDADLLQGLLDLRLDAARQHRPGARGADGRARLPTSRSPRRRFPDNGRTVFKGHLFVGDVLLSESGMRNHPLTPMTDANLVRVLQAQLATARGAGARPRRVGLVDHRAVGASSAAIGERFEALAQAKASRSRSPTRSTTTTCMRLGAAVQATCRWSAPARAWRSACRANFGIAASGEAASLPPVDGLSRDRLGQLLGGDQRARSAQFLRSRRRGAPGRCARARRRRTTRWSTSIAAWARRAVGGGARARRCSSTAPRRRRRSRRRRRRAAATTSARASSGSSPAVARRAGRERRAPPRRRRRRDLGRVRAGARRRAAAHRRPDRSRRALVPRRAGARRPTACTWR